MSNWREQLEQEEETKAIMAWLTEFYHYPILLFLVAFAFWNRVRNYTNYIVDGEIYFAGNDPWYHMRSTEYAVHNFPQTMPFDPWTGFPTGRFVGQFGTIYDQAIAFVALVVGLGSPSQYTTRLVILLAPAVMGLLVCIPAYFIGRRLGDRFGGIIAVMFVALAPDRLLQVSLAGSVQHHTVEALMMALTVLAVMVALTAAEREKPVYELLEAREFDALRGTIGWSMLAGITLGIYIWVWPPGVWMFAILGAFFVIHLSIEHVRNRSPEHPAFVGAITMATAAILQLAVVRSFDMAVAGRSILHPGLGLFVAIGIVALAWFSRELESRDISEFAYPAGIVGVAILGVGFFALVLPETFDFFVHQVNRVFGFMTETEGGAATIGEAQSGASRDDLFRFYRFAIFTALIGALLILVRQFLDEDPAGAELLIVVWAAFITAATFTQLRFGYYMTVPVGALNAVLVGYIMKFARTPDSSTLPETYQVLTILVVIFLMFVPMLGMPVVGVDQTAQDLSDQASQPGTVMGWSDSLNWMSNNTPEPGQYGNPDGEAMEYYGTYAKTDDFDYPENSYGVLSWWDYGHWITSKGERIANANPFQQHTTQAANFLIAQDEETANQVITDEFQDSESATTRYVMVDALMAETETVVRTENGLQPTSGKFFAPTDFHNNYSRSDFYRHAFGDQRKIGIIHKQAYYETMISRLYNFHGSAQEPIPMYAQWSGQETIQQEGPLEGSATVSAPNQSRDPLVTFADNMSQARDITEDDPTNQLGGIGPYPEERVPALEHYRLVHMDRVPAVPRTGGDDELWQTNLDRGMAPGPYIRTYARTIGLIQQAENSPGFLNQTQGGYANFLYPNTPSFTKTFERVPGATIEGSIEVNETVPETVTLDVEMDPANGKTFNYTQQVDVEDGEFTATVPYATTGYDEYGVEDGYTNESVRATSAYDISTESYEIGNESYHYQTTINVTEGQVLGEEDGPSVTLVEKPKPEEPPDYRDLLEGDSSFQDRIQEQLEEQQGEDNETTNETTDG